MDTGLGREGLSIISQGKVDEILSLKPEDRRGLIEEAAGIIKYKYRKREAERKLKDTEEHLVRVTDIISELEERVGPLGEQAEKAKQYKTGKEELDQLELSLEVHDIDRNRLQETQLLEKKQQLEDGVAACMASLSGQEAELEQLRFEFGRQEAVYQEQQQSFYQLQNQLERRTNGVQANRQLLESAEEQLERLQQELDGQQAETLALEKTVQDTRRQAAEAEQIFSQQQRILAEDEQKLQELERQGAQQQQDEEQQQSDVFANMQEQARNHNALLRLEQDLSSDERDREKIKGKLSALTQELERQQVKQAELREKMTVQQEQESQYHQQVTAIEQEIEQRKEQQLVLRQQLTDGQAAWQEKQSRAKVLKEMEESGEGYQYGVKSILEQKQQGKLQGIIGTVSQLITVPQHLEKAVETAMGVSLQNIVTEDDKQAQAAIQYLKERKKGRATFLPLNTVKGQRAEENLSNEENVLGLAVDLIAFDKKYEKILLHLLGKVWVVKDLASAVAIGKKKGFSYRLVTLDGELVTPGGALTGGNHEKERGGLLARQRQILELEDAVKQLEQQIQQQNEALEAYYAVTGEKKEALAQLRSQEEAFIRSAVELEQEQRLQEREEKRLQNELHVEQFHLEEQEKQREAYRTALEQERARQGELAEQERNLARQAEQLKERRQVLQTQQKEVQDRYQENTVQLATAKQRWELFAQQSDSEEQRYQGLRKTLQQKQSEYEKLAQKKAEYEQEIAENLHYIQQEQEQLAAGNTALEDYREKRQAKQERIALLETAVGQGRQEKERLREQKYQLDLSLNKVQGYLSGGFRRLAQNFDCTYEEAQAKAVAMENIPQTQRRIQEIKGLLGRLGEINFTAIEEFEQVQQRLQFLQKQVADLHDARQSLNKVIEEMEKIMAQKFAETYREVNARFSQVFQSMFGGGQARLELSDPTDYLLTGIEIVAQPPGKKEQVLTLLSGGERAMTAIALLFSLLTVKPSPFCILDEIESALDDVNIDRFARFIRDYAAKTQFIIISHRKGTMEAADVLYGVAMENKGVSRLMSVKVSDYV